MYRIHFFFYPTPLESAGAGAGGPKMRDIGYTWNGGILSCADGP